MAKPPSPLNEKGAKMTELNKFQQLVASQTADERPREARLEAARFSLVEASGRMAATLGTGAGEMLSRDDEIAVFNALCDLLFSSALIAEGLGTNLEAVAQYGMDRARRGNIGSGGTSQ